VDANYSEIEVGDKGSVLVYNGNQKPETGDRVVLDTSGHVIVKNLGKEDDQFTYCEETGITWDDIGGLTEAKEALKDAIELPFLHPEIYRQYGKRLPKGVGLYGPPGCGKTLLGKAAATSIARIHGKKVSTGFNYVKAPEILSKWVGIAEGTIRSIFDKCRAHKKAHGYPAVVFIDEADAILAKRGSGISSDVEKTIVPMFLSEMDGLEDSSAFIILATNRPDILDPAVIREGRIDRMVKVGRPNAEMAKEIFSIHLEKKPLSEGGTREDYAQMVSEDLYSEKRALYTIERKSGEPVHFTLGNVTSGAMIAGIVEEAVSSALKRDLKSGVCKGVQKDDLVASVDRSYGSYKNMSHKDELDAFTAEWKADVKTIKRI
jgi:proteasome-associated ATPase